MKINFRGYADRNLGIDGQFIDENNNEIMPEEIGMMIREGIPFEFTLDAAYAWNEFTS